MIYSATPRRAAGLAQGLLLCSLVALSLSAQAQSTQPASAPATAPASQPAHNPLAILHTNLGPITVELLADAAPLTVANFVDLAQGNKVWIDPQTQQRKQEPYYDGLIFHRVIPNFMIQGGDPLGTGRGGPGYKFPDEINADALGLDQTKAFEPSGAPHPWLGIQSPQQLQQTLMPAIYRKVGVTDEASFNAKREEVQAELTRILEKSSVKEFYELLGYQYTPGLPSVLPTRGMLAMANAGPNTNGSQFFINLADTPWLAGKHTVFGRVVEGMEVVDRIAEVNTGPQNRPTDPIVIRRVEIKASPAAAATQTQPATPY